MIGGSCLRDDFRSLRDWYRLRAEKQSENESQVFLQYQPVDEQVGLSIVQLIDSDEMHSREECLI